VARTLGSGLWGALGALAVLSVLLGTWAIVAPPPQRSLSYGVCVLLASALALALLFATGAVAVSRVAGF
jgi:hypothetical protein